MGTNNVRRNTRSSSSTLDEILGRFDSHDYSRVETESSERNVRQALRNDSMDTYREPIYDTDTDYDEDESTGFCDDMDLEEELQNKNISKNGYTYQDVIDEINRKDLLNLSYGHEDDYSEGDDYGEPYEDGDNYDYEGGDDEDDYEDERKGVPIKLLVGLGVVIILVASFIGVRVVKDISNSKKAKENVVEVSTTVDDLKEKVDRLYASDEKKDIRSGVYVNDLNELYDELDGLADSEKKKDSYKLLYDELNTISGYMADKDTVSSMNDEGYDLNTSGLVSKIEDIKSNAASKYTVPGLVLSINSLCDTVNKDYEDYFSLKNELNTVKVEDFNPDNYKSRISSITHTVNKRELKDIYDKLVAEKKVLDAKTEEEKQAAEAERKALEESQEKAKKAAEASQKKAEEKAKEAEDKLAELQKKQEEFEKQLAEEKAKKAAEEKANSEQPSTEKVSGDDIDTENTDSGADSTDEGSDEGSLEDVF